MFVCDSCGCENIQKKMWVDIETETVEDSIEPPEYFCPDCEETPKVTEVNESKWKRILELPFDDVVSQLESIGVVYNHGDTDLDMRLAFMDSVNCGDLWV